MTTDTKPRMTNAEFQQKLLINLGEHEQEIRLKIAHANAEIHNLRIQARQHSDRMDNDSARAAMAQAGAHHESVRAMTKQLADIELERQGVIRGSDPRLDAHGHAERTQSRQIAQTEHAQALKEFNDHLAATGPLVAAAKRLVQVCIGMRLEPPQAAIEISKSP